MTTTATIEPVISQTKHGYNSVATTYRDAEGKAHDCVHIEHIDACTWAPGQHVPVAHAIRGQLLYAVVFASGVHAFAVPRSR